ncbi:MAG: BON domain-containing protein [Gemmatimonadetes bacterium]|nr:BON domain-containing protein [Gemmatimonadota bacterium]
MRRDADIKRDVLSELDWDPQVDFANVGITVSDGVVTLSGQVTSYVGKRAAERATQRVLGVTAIAEDLRRAASSASGVARVHDRITVRPVADSSPVHASSS